jgi:glycosyltransferase involved in cell wall biosynthesis
MQSGLEDFDFPGTIQALGSRGGLPDVLSCHNLHGGYFDLRALPELSRRILTVLTLHDEWTYTGHCGYALQCSGWLGACGSCPDLSRPPRILQDSTAANLGVKRTIWRDARVHVVTPSQWLMQRATRSILAPAMASSHVIPNGIDTHVFAPGDKLAARAHLGLPIDARVLLFVANSGTGNPYKDGSTMEKAVAAMTGRKELSRLILLVVGGDGSIAAVEPGRRISVPYQRDPRELARYYQAADLYLHAAHGDNFPLVVLEALACGTPVVATAIGGIPEQVREGVTGLLTPPGDAGAMAETATRLLLDDALRGRMGAVARQDAVDRFSLERMVSNYVQLYQEQIKQRTDTREN